jgi:hypothetical protein
MYVACGHLLIFSILGSITICHDLCRLVNRMLRKDSMFSSLDGIVCAFMDGICVDIVAPHMLLKVETVALLMWENIAAGKIFDGPYTNLPNHILDRAGI